MKIAIVIPAYNEEKVIGDTIDKIAFDKKDIVVVDDGSSDDTSTIAKERGTVVLRHNTNLGKGRAHKTAFQYALKSGYDWVITMDADGQHNPDEISLFINAMKNNKGDIIIGERNLCLRTMPFIRFMVNLLTSFIVSILCEKRIKDSQSGFRAIKRDVLLNVPLSTNNFQTESEIIVKAVRMRYKVASIPISVIYRNEKSYINPIIDTLRFISLAVKSLWI
jgi:glycosyltransferase involved in cell wall biosynthesis